MDASAVAARAFFSGAFSHLALGAGGAAGAGASGLVEVSVKSPSGTWKSTHLEHGALLEAVGNGSFRDWSQRGRDIYYGVVSLTERPEHSWRRGGAALRGSTEILWLDVDVEAPGREGEEYFESVASAVSGVDACLGPCLREASLVVGSGWGVQYVIPLATPIAGHLASRVVRVLVGMIGECTGKKIDRVWDVTRVMRMPGTWNWRAGPDPSDARETGIVRWPLRGPGRLEIGNVIDEIARLVNDVAGRSRSDVSTPEQQLEELLDRYGGIAGAADTDPGAYDGDWVGDIERIAYEELAWSDVLEPEGWRCVSGCGPGWEAREHEQVWERPGKPGETGDWAVKTGDRSAVVYADRPELLVVYSDSASTGFDAGLRGSGHRGEGAGVGVISKWRAWVDLACKGNEELALERVTSVAHGAHGAYGSGVVGGATGDPVAERLGKAWASETDWMGDWVRTLEEGVMKAHEKDAGAKLPTKDLLGWDPETEEPSP